MFLLERRRLTELDEVGLLRGHLNGSHTGQPTDCYSDPLGIVSGLCLSMQPFLGVGSWAQYPGCPIPSLLKAHCELIHSLPSWKPQKPESMCCMI